MALSDKRILEHKKIGNIVIEPYDKKNLATSSYDVTLGDWFFREQDPWVANGLAGSRVYNIWNKRHTDAVWGTVAEKARKAKEILKNFDFDGISPDDKIILLAPGETILGHTQEFIGGQNVVTTMMKARSSLGRNFIEVCKCAGWGDVGYINRWTMEITNNSRHYTIPLVVGRRIAQIIFYETGEILDRDYTKEGKYLSVTDISKIKKNWNPSMMLPRLYKDREIKK